MAVGGTDLTTTGPGGAWATETYWSYDGTDYGGGGWGTNVDIPSWQVTAADDCNSEGGGCSETYRNVPDVAANANFTFYVCADQSGCTENEYGGTSFAAPMWAGYLALANQQAVINGVPAPGFIDPTIYPLEESNGDADFHDITSDANGSNGFPCVTGYNLCDGWGSPNGALLINALTGKQGPSFTLSANPSSLSIQQGSNGTSTITVNDFGGFNGNVTLSASGQPSGVTVGFNPNPTATTSTATVAVGSGVATGSYTITIGGVSGSLSASTSISLTVTASGPQVSFNPTSLTWGKIKVGKTGGAKTETVTNTGGSTLDITSIATSGDFALKAFTSKKKCGSTLAAGASCIVKVTFTDNAPGSPQSVPLSGTGK